MRWPDARRTLGGWLLAGLCLLALPASAFDTAGYEEAISTIRCDCGCHPQSVKDCACGRAGALRDEMRGAIDGGLTGEQVIAAYVEQHGEQIRIAPTARGFNLIAWLGPLFGLVGYTRPERTHRPQIRASFSVELVCKAGE